MGTNIKRTGPGLIQGTTRAHANLWICYIKNDWVALAPLTGEVDFFCEELKILNRRILILTNSI